MRLFVAIEAPESWRDAGRRIQAALPDSVRRQARLVDPANMHITLRFIGEVDEVLVPGLQETLGRSLPPVDLQLELGRVNTFGAPARTSVVWLGVGGDVEGLRALALRADQAVAEALGLPPGEFPPEERRYSPHITLARVRRQVSSEQRHHLAEIIQTLGPPAGLPFVAHEATLIHSSLGPHGSRYETLGRWG